VVSPVDQVAAKGRAKIVVLIKSVEAGVLFAADFCRSSIGTLEKPIVNPHSGYYLRRHGVLSVAYKRVELEISFDPFEEQLALQENLWVKI